ncbi:kinase-like domain-containing protein [Desarmillaria ectypa]|nr:kinase-like domain-containing protein [Desarmillaria ectypa]
MPTVKEPPETPPAPPEQLDSSEIFWRDIQPWLQSRGYQLRRRYRPGWVPAWKLRKTSLFWWEFEDSIKAHHPSVMDAKRISDEKPVMLKRILVSQHPHEVEVAKYLSSISDAKNHSNTLLDVLTLPGDEDVKIFVMPLLRRFDDPPFDTIGEVVEFLRQIFEGLQFLHHQNIAHRDVGVFNILMDGSMFPDGYHPACQSRTPDFKHKARFVSRTSSSPRYFLIDFGLSIRFNDSEKHLAVPIRGADKTVPEFKEHPGALYDPFPTDIYYLGNFIREHFFEGLDSPVKAKLGLEFIRPLVDETCCSDPLRRPCIDDVVQRFETIRRSLPERKLKSRLVNKDEDFIESVELSFAHWCRRIQHRIHHDPPVPTP